MAIALRRHAVVWRPIHSITGTQGRRRRGPHDQFAKAFSALIPPHARCLCAERRTDNEASLGSRRALQASRRKPPISAVIYSEDGFRMRSTPERKRLMYEAKTRGVALRAYIQGRSPAGKCGRPEWLRLRRPLPCFDAYHRVFNEFGFVSHGIR